MKRIYIVAALILTAFLGMNASVFAQMKARKPAKKTAAKKTPVVIEPIKAEETIPATEMTEAKKPVKKNERPETQTTAPDNSGTQEPQKKNQSQKTPAGNTVSKESQNVFSYEFSQPNFVVSRLVINHDENGKGTITFEKKNVGESVTDPIQLSAVTLERIKNLFQTLNFLDSTEDYQSTIRQYPHLGTMKIRLKKDGKERVAEYNWTENKDAKALTDEYRKIGEQFVWIFDISVALENQPLEAPGLMDTLDSLLRRNEISDPPQIVPLLKKLGDDERIPLIARNHAKRIVKDIEKKAGK